MKHPDFPTAAVDASNGHAPAVSLFDQRAPVARPHPSLGRLAALDADGAALVETAGADIGHPHSARSCVALTPDMVGKDVLVVFIDGDSSKPVIVGVLQTPPSTDLERRVESDGERVVISARSEIVLRCGGASITLTRAGKVLLSGAYVSSRSTGVNRIRGGSVEIN